MKQVFDWMTRISLRFRGITLALSLVIIAIGGVAAVQLKQELLPPVEFPQTIILAQTSGLNSDQVLKVVTERMETAIDAIPEIVNVDSTTSSAIGTVIVAANDFGQDQERLKQEIQAAINSVWLPGRVIAAPAGQDAAAFAREMMGSLTPDVMIYLANRNPNFLFQLSPQAWEALSAETAEAALTYLAGRTADTSASKTALQQLVEQEVAPQLEAVEGVASVQVSGGQTLPGEADVFGSASQEATIRDALVFQLSPDAWSAASARAGITGALDETTVTTLRETSVEVPMSAPELPESWRSDLFATAQDLLELQTAARSLGAIFNGFMTAGEIRGALGTVSDLRVSDIEQMLAIDPTMVKFFEAKHLVAMSPEVFAVLPQDFLDGLDGFTRDALAANALAADLTGEVVEAQPEPLPNPWRIQPPSIITFSFADLPLATFSVSSTGEIAATSAPEAATTEVVETAASTTEATTVTNADLPEGPALPQLITLIGNIFGAELVTADQLVSIPLSGQFADLLGEDSLSAAAFFNAMTQFSSLAGGGATSGDAAAGTPQIDFASFIPALTECGVNPLDLLNPANLDLGKVVISCVPTEVIAYLVANDATFASNLNAAVYEAFSEETLALEGMNPPLADAWDTLADRPQFQDTPLRSAADVLALGEGQASAILNRINANVPEAFAGYEVRLFDSLTPAVLRFWALREAGFYSALDAAVITKLAPTALAQLPADVVADLDAETAEAVQAIAAGTQESAAAALAARYQTDTIPADPSAPALNAEWQFIANFLGIELNNAFDLFRFPSATGTPSQFINGLFNTAQGASFAPNLLGNLSLEAFEYIAAQDANFVGELNPPALNLLPATIFDTLPTAIQEKAAAGEVFRPTTQVTRTNGNPSLLVTVYKDAEANTVEAYYRAFEAINAIDEEDEAISVSVAFEQASFIEQSIEGVVREGALGAFFAVVVILVFLSGGSWGWSGRRISGAVLIAISLGIVWLAVSSQLGAVDGDLLKAWDKSDVVVRVLALFVGVIGIIAMLWPRNIPYPAWRSTMVIAVSIPLSVMGTMAIMHWVLPFVHGLLLPLGDAGIVGFLLRLFPEDITLNIMTLSGLTVAIGRVVDDSIVVLENIVRKYQEKTMTREEAILSGTREVSVAIFTATIVTVVVFLPLGLTGGLVGEFFLPFGLAVTYSLLASFVVAVTVVPALAYLFIRENDVAEEEEGVLEHGYVASLTWTQAKHWRKWGVIFLAFISAGFGAYLFTTRPATFLPDFGEPQIVINAELPQGTGIIQTNDLVLQAEQLVRDTIPEDELLALRAVIGGGGLSFQALLGGGGVSENQAQVTINIANLDKLDAYTETLKEGAIAIFGEDAVNVSAQTLSGDGFGGFELVLTGGDQATLFAADPCIRRVLNTVDGLTNVVNNLIQAGIDTGECPTVAFNAEGSIAEADRATFEQSLFSAIRGAITDLVILDVDYSAGVRVLVSAPLAETLSNNEAAIKGILENRSELSAIADAEAVVVETTTAVSEGDSENATILRSNGSPAISYSGEVLTEDTINLAPRAIRTVNESLNLPEGLVIGQGFDTQFQTQGFAGIFVAIGIALVIVILILIVVFQSPIYWLAVILSVVVAPVGAALALSLTNRVLGISALIGLLMLLGLVVTNAVVLIDLVGQYRYERGESIQQSLIEAGKRRFRPILMTVLATIFALLPLAAGLSKGAIIAAELGTVVIGGIISSTVLTLLVVPAAYSLLSGPHERFVGLFRRNRNEADKS